MLLLSIDTSTASCSVAVHGGDGPDAGTLLGCYELFTERTSAAMLTTLIGDVVRHTGHELAQLDAIAVSKGPGSYTGLRIGVSTAKGLCFALDKPLLAINTLQAMTEQVRPYATLFADQPILFCPMIDARRMEVYCTFYDTTGREVRPTAAEIITPDSFADLLASSRVLFFGDGAAKCQPALGHHANAVFLDQLIIPSARTVGQLATQAFASGQFEDPATFEPFYLKEFMTTQPRRATA
ncbi:MULTISPECIES: tRNA (adenosine(37)-N6)-threonylcarbamoyltransferase complex dimerization subunit type 1 TsaB [Spirosoma]|uniref:N(6)-L-threonylcarbamoyladenine synthase n=1 Tax=Spirosoma sordidisoli TaxID=2502893 RepID=A0A4Q2UQ31_9BACT|nr:MULTISPECIES: tRNA (adenosine(37)-N6)-threonylcarbamoyltransferase complex dimerization subunit type 1 TsaB [Spirosoma]RYC71853.1 tRNA (adenosine(37)-N6)-threonylcarbamoyltransferase complex dimerization subunit type 1 TsaB [Spirosoma sordidisoli]